MAAVPAWAVGITWGIDKFEGVSRRRFSLAKLEVQDNAEYSEKQLHAPFWSQNISPHLYPIRTVKDLLMGNGAQLLDPPSFPTR